MSVDKWVVDYGIAKYIWASKNDFTSYTSMGGGEEILYWFSNCCNIEKKENSSKSNILHFCGSGEEILYHGDSRIVAVLVLRHKEEAFKMFISYKVGVETHLNKKIKRVRSDSECKFISLKMIFAKINALYYSLESNDMTERKNKTTRVIQNITPHRAIDKKPINCGKVIYPTWNIWKCKVFS